MREIYIFLGTKLLNRKIGLILSYLTSHFTYRMTATKYSHARLYSKYSPTKMISVPPSLSDRLLSPYVAYTVGVWTVELFNLQHVRQEKTLVIQYILSAFRIQIH